MKINAKWLEKNLLGRVLNKDERAVIQDLEILSFKPYDTILKEGEVCGGLLILRSGTTKIMVKHDGEEVRLAEGCEGSLFSKKSLVDPDSVSTAEVVATTACTVYKLSSKLFVEILHKQHNLAFLLLASIISYQEKIVQKQNKQLAPVLLTIAKKANSLPLVVKLLPVIFIIIYIIAFFTIPYRM